MIDMVRVYREQIGSLCEPGEQPRAIGGVMYHPGVETSADQHPPGWREVSLDPWGPSSDRLEHDVERLLSGETMRGPAGSAADGLRHAVHTAQAPALLVTDRRLLVVRVADDPTIFWSAHRGAVAAVRHRRHLLQAGRLEIAFTDTSVVRLVAGLLLARRAKRLARAWEAPPPAVRGP